MRRWRTQSPGEISFLIDTNGLLLNKLRPWETWGGSQKVSFKKKGVVMQSNVSCKEVTCSQMKEWLVGTDASFRGWPLLWTPDKEKLALSDC